MVFATSPSSFSSLRPLVLRLARLGASYPIELIVTVFCAVTLVYFQLLKVVRTSDFLLYDDSPSSPSSSLSWYPSVAYTPSTGLWSTVPAALTTDDTTTSPVELWLKQLVVEVPSTLELARTLELKDTVTTGTQAALASPGVECYKVSGSPTCWTVETQPTLNRTARSFAFTSPESAKAFGSAFSSLPALKSETLELKALPRRKRRGTRNYASFFSRAGVEEQEQQEAEEEVGDWEFERSLEDMKSVKWMLFAARAFVMRFYGLAKKADSADIFVMLIAYLLMHSTFVSLFLNMRRLSLSLRPQSRSSGMWLASSALVSSCLAFLFALLTAWYLEITVNPVLLGEALPFLVITVGFEKPFVLTRAVFSNPSIGPSGAYSAGSRGTLTPSRDGLSPPSERPSFSNGGASFPGASRFGLRFAPPVPSREIVLQAVAKTGVPIVRDYAIEVAVLVVGAMSGVAGLKEFCHLAALILVFDCLMLMGFYVAVLTIMVEIHRIKVIRHLQRTDSSADLARLLDDPTPLPDDAEVGSGSEDEEEEPKLTLREKVVKLVTGTAPGQKAKSDSPTARLKVLLIAAFLTLHALNLVTTLTRETALGRSREHAPSTPHAPFVDTTLPLYSTALAQLVSAHDRGTELLVHIAPALQYHAIDPTAPSAAPAAAYLAQKHYEEQLSTATGSLANLERFMSRWSRLVGDPIISKWIVIALGISVFLNGYLLKGIASTDSGFQAGSAAEAAARILLASTTGSALDDGDDAAATRRLRQSFSLLKDDLQNEWTARDAQAMTREHRREEKVAEKQAHKAAPELVKVATKKPSRTDSADDSSEDSPPPSPILIRTKPRKSTKADSTETTSVPTLSLPESSASSTPTTSTSAQPGAERTIKLSPSTVALVPLGQVPETPRDFEVCVKIYDGGEGALLLNDEEIIMLVQKGKIAAYALEKILKDYERAVSIRRALISRASARKNLEDSDLPFQHFDYSRVMGQCCENVVGYMPVPVGIAGPLRIDNEVVPLPMATVEGALVASASRGCKALNILGGVTTVVTQDAMTRGPALTFPNVTLCAAAKRWIDSVEGSDIMKASFNSTSRFARLKSLRSTMAGRTLYVRFATQTGDAMGMNMISKGTERALDTMQTDHFPEMRISALSGNYCTDKKPAAINWIEGRGKSVVAEGIIPGHAVKSVLKTTVDDIVKLNITKNLVGSAMAGTMGGNNAHAANILAAMFLATGQDIAQVVESANCITLMEATNGGEDLLITCSMPSIEVGTVGGGTILLPQGAMLNLLGVKGPHPTNPGENAQRLARVICAAVLAGELSLMASLAAGTLVKSHLALNRSAPGTPAIQTPAHSRPTTPAANGAPQAFVSSIGRTVLSASTPINPGLAPTRP